MIYAAFDRHKQQCLHQKELLYSYAQFNMKALRNETLLVLSSHELQFVEPNHKITETNLICVCSQGFIFLLPHNKIHRFMCRCI